MESKLGYRGHYDWPGMLDFLRLRAVPGVECVDALSYTRSVVLGAQRGWLSVQHLPSESALSLTASPSVQANLPSLIAQIHLAFDLETDTDQVERALTLGLTTTVQGLRIPGTLAPFDTAVRAILGQQISVRAASTLAARVSQCFGEPISEQHEAPAGLSHYPLSAERCAIAAPAELAQLGIIQNRAKAIIALAQAVTDHKVDFAAPAAALIAALVALPGIGRWTANYIAMRTQNHRDACLADDLLVHRAFEQSAQRKLQRSEVRHALERFSPWRSYVTLNIWRGAKPLAS